MPRAKSGNPIRDKFLNETFGKDFSGKDKEEKENIIYTSFLETDDYILEQVKSATSATRRTSAQDTESFFFIRYSKLNGEIEEVDEYVTEEKTYKPIVDDTVMKGGVSLPSGVEEYGETSDLIEEIRNFVHENCEMPEFFEKFVPYVVLFYWVYEKFPFIPYLHFVGGTGTGKTTAMETLGSISYKAIDTTGSLTISSLFRIATSWRGTMLIDEFDSIGQGANEMVSFLKSGVSNRLILRTEGDVKREVKAYIVKSPKMFTSEEPIEDAGLQSRTFVVMMEKNKRRLPLYKLPDYHEKAMHIRNKLLLWRLRNFNKIDLKEIKFGFPELEGFDRRVQQIVTPIYYFSDDKSKLDLVDFATRQQEETLRERRESLAGQIFSAIAETSNSTVPLALISDAINKGKSEKLISERKIAGIIRKVLGFEIQRMGHDNIYTVIIDPDQVNDTKKYYGLISSATSADVADVAKVVQSISEDYIEVAQQLFTNEKTN